MAIEIPDLDPRNEDQIVAETIQNLPAELSDRNPSSPIVKVIEALGAMYGAATFYLNQLPEKLQLTLLDFLGLEPDPASFAVVTLTFASTSSGATIPAGTLVKTGTGADAQIFATNTELVLGASTIGDVLATATVAGAAGNVGANTIELLDSPISGVDSVTNGSSASGGEDEETVTELIARAELENRALERAVTGPDYELFGDAVDGVVRVKHSHDLSSHKLHIVVDDANQRWFDDPSNATDLAIRTAVEDAIAARKLEGTSITALQHAPRVVAITNIEIELVTGASSATVAQALQSAFENYLSALTTFDADGEVLRTGWEYGRTLYLNELISIADRIDGVQRVGDITIRHSDDFGATTTDQTNFVSLAPASDGLEGASHNLIHEGYSALGVSLNLVEL